MEEKILVLFNMFDDGLHYFVTDDLSWLKFNGVTIGVLPETKAYEDKQKELSAKLWHASGEEKQGMDSFTPEIIPTLEGRIQVVYCGFIP